ncbi:hypothetical protein Hanom_Chr02g00109021 [Helianthus anomalus]
MDDGVLSCACVGIIPNVFNCVSSYCKVKWKELMFEVLVEEDVGEWVPDCVIDLLDDEEITPTEQTEMNNGNGNAVQSGNGIVFEPHLNGVFNDNDQEPISSKSGKRKGEIF